MGRVKVQFPDNNPLYTADIAVRISDINYGNHVGNDSILSIIHEARYQMLHQRGFTEMNVDGAAMIMADVTIAFKAESFYGDKLLVDVYADEIRAMSFSLLYRIVAKRGEVTVDIAHAKTGMVCFDYKNRKVAAMNETMRNLLTRTK